MAGKKGCEVMLIVMEDLIKESVLTSEGMAEVSKPKITKQNRTRDTATVYMTLLTSNRPVSA